MTYHDQLGLTREEFEDQRAHFENRTYRGRPYEHLPDYRSKVNRGTVLIEGSVVQGFPKIPRTLVLETGIPRYFDDEFAVEEKMNGYNVRVAHVDEPLAFIRGGVICPFTTCKVRSLLALDEFFEDHPDQMLCGEMVGPENPYTPFEYPEIDSLAFRAFDVRHRETGEPVPVEARRELCTRYDIPQVQFHGLFDPSTAATALKELIDELDAEGREGIVMKSADVSHQLKYTTSSANQGNLEYAFSLPFDYGQDFMFRRIIRDAFQAVEWEEDGEAATERAGDLGTAVLCSMVETIRKVQEGETVGERHTVRGDPDCIDALFDHLRAQRLRLEIESDRVVDGERLVTFVKKTQKSNDRIQAYLDGKIVTE
ncbi:MAG: RNA ligase [Halobacteriota archaeon]